MKKTYEERFWSRVQKTDGCWLWTAGKNNNGYGWFKVNGKMVLAHRFSYELHIGPIPEGLVLDHVKARGCTNRTCVNPAHLEPVTIGENTRRGDSGRIGGERQRSKTHCLKGHEYSEKNTRIRPDGSRLCRECHRIQEAAVRKTKSSEAMLTC